ncbi:EAL domain-containing protein [Comamonadaceae bacterium G21597-S1]|nr:EAL domain-containing protein [Comamonadaceae bacterium G21597-S1]
MTFAISRSPGTLAGDDRFDLGAWAMLSPDYAAWAREASVLAGELERGLHNGELFAVIQPRMALVPGGGVRLAGAEMLARWCHPQRGLVSPGQFIPIAEVTGLIEPLGDFMLETAARTLAGWLARDGQATGLAVNLSARQFSSSKLPLRLARLRSDYGLPPGLIELEVTESTAMRDADRTEAVLGELRTVGVPVSIDDFGTGFSSLAYLRRFQVDALKIDKSLIDDLGVDPHANAVCNAIVQLGRSLDIKVVAEGVEHVRQLDYLRHARCDEIQGYIFSRPLDADVFERAWLRPSRVVPASREAPRSGSDGIAAVVAAAQQLERADA